MTNAAHDTLPKKTRKQPGWFAAHADELKDLIDARNTAISSNLARPTS